ncbi:T9SS type A sorting domain-containing protein [uncultured Parabacteroides sp.]|uniref:T9SS type A sorting domain-containing protein n=1 Tax=uncultured Parabacteroides sp. TaxID=512312 RepID=UPI0025EC2EEA|nr:T9SS type A sorting domain-containing protein [uncultured Parabacteroides sp.]
MIRKNFILLLLLHLAGGLFAQLSITPTISPSIPEGSNINLGNHFNATGGTPTKWTLDGKEITPGSVTLSYKDDGKLLQCSDGTNFSDPVPIKIVGRPLVTSLTGMPTTAVKVGQQINLTVEFKANGSTGHTYKWYIGNEEITGQTTKTLSYTVKNTDHGKTIKVAVKATEFTDAVETSVGITFDGTMVTDPNPVLPAGEKTDNTIFPVTVGETFTDPVVEYDGPTNGGANFFITQDAINYNDGQSHTVNYKGKSYVCTVKVIEPTPYTYLSSTITSASRVTGSFIGDNNTLFFDSGIYVPKETAGQAAFYKDGLKMIGTGSKDNPTIIGPNYGIWTGSSYEGHVVYRVFNNMVIENIVYDGGNIKFYGQVSSGGSNQKNNYYFITIGSAPNVILRDITFRNIGNSSTTNVRSVLNFVEGTVDRDPDRKRYYINILFESGKTSSTYAPININSTDGHYFKDIVFGENFTCTGADYISITGQNNHVVKEPGCRNIVFDGKLTMPAGKRIRIWRYTSRGISFPKEYKYLELKTTSTGYSSLLDYTYDMYVHKDITSPSTSKAYLDISNSSYIAFNSLNASTFNALNTLHTSASSPVSAICTLPEPKLVKLVSNNSNAVGNFTIPSYFGKKQTNIVAVNALADPLTQVNETSLIPFSGTAIGFPSTDPEMIKLHNIDFSEEYSIYNAIKDGDNSVANSRYGSFYNCKFIAPATGDPLTIEGNILASIADGSLCSGDPATLPFTLTMNDVASKSWTASYHIKNSTATKTYSGTGTADITVDPAPITATQYVLSKVAIAPDQEAFITKDSVATLTPVTVDAGTISGSNTVGEGANVTLTTSGSDGRWESADPTIATVNETTGIVTGVKPGKTTIYYYVEKDGCEGAAEFAITVTTMNRLQWSVSTTTNEGSSFSDVENNSTTTVMVGTPVFVQIRPINVDDIDYDHWAIEYRATPIDYLYPMEGAIKKTVRYDFNKGEAHTLKGSYYYNVTKLILYKGNTEVTSYSYMNATCTHTIIIQDEPVIKKPALQWSVSTVTHELPYFKDVDDQTTISVNYGTPVFVQIRPVGYDGITFERWDVEYSVTPVEHYYGMNPIIKTERHSFNNKEAHTEKGTYIYTVTKLTLYDLYGNQIIETYDYNDSPYKHTIVIGDGEGPGPGPGGSLQWSVSTASNKLEDFRDVDNLTTTAVIKGTPVYVQIRPVGFNNVTYDSWEIEYTATPVGYHYPLEEAVPKTVRYTFNKGEAHTLVGTYVYTVNKLTLYNGESIATEQYYTEPAYIHTIIIRDGGLIGLGEIAPYCSVEGEFRIPVQLLDPDNILEYSVRFSNEALNAGFKDTEYRDVTPNYLTVPVSSIIAKGIYTGNVYVRKKSDPGLVELHPFEIEVMQTTMITRQPQSVNVCDGDAFTLSVEAIGINLSYQWFFNEEAIPGATSDSYTAALTPDKEGIYYVDVYGDCGMESSRTVTVSKNGLRILVKWNEFLYITNPDNEFVRFQWYKDGQKIDKNGTSIYYSVPEGLLGTYFIQAYRADDTYVVSCPITFETLTQFQSTRVYPTMVNKNTPITIRTGAPNETPESAVVEVYNLNGQIVNRLEMKTWETTLPTDMASGSYIVKVTTESGRTTTHKIIIK